MNLADVLIACVLDMDQAIISFYSVIILKIYKCILFIYVVVVHYASYLALLRRLKGKQFAVDIHIAELLVFPPGTVLHLHPLYQSGSVILQDKVGPPQGCIYVDSQRNGYPSRT